MDVDVTKACHYCGQVRADEVRCRSIDMAADCSSYWKQRCVVLDAENDGLRADLDSAIAVAFKRGATDWVRLNYPQEYTRLSANQEPQS